MADATLAAFITARWDERAATAQTWLDLKPATNCYGEPLGKAWPPPALRRYEGESYGPWARSAVPFITENDPEFVVADIASKRALLDALERNVRYWSSDDHSRAAAEGALEVAQRCFAEPFSGHPDYKAEWRIDG
jgi:hypothetical protein